MTRPRLLDLFCGAGGAGTGYHRAGFEVVGVDVRPQSHYPFEFRRMDCRDIFGGPRWWSWVRSFDAIHASPPCQFVTAYRRRPDHVAPTLNLIPATRSALRGYGLPYVIENVPGAPLVHPIQLCGSSFGLDVRRHRLFEGDRLPQPPKCDHAWQTPRFPQATNRSNLRRTVEVGVWRIPLEVQQQAMGIDWMTREELSQAIPPAYTEWIGQQLLASLGIAA